MSTFALDLAKFAAKANGNGNAVVREVIANIAHTVDLRSAVGDPSLWKHKAPAGYVGGRFRGEWQLGIDEIPSGLTGVVALGSDHVEGIVASIPEQPAGHVAYFANNMPYAQQIEDGTGPNNWVLHAAPAGVVSRTVVEFQGIVDEAAAKVAR